MNNLESGLKETKGRVKQMGDTDTQGMMYTGQGTSPNETERAYDNMSDINNAARIDTNYEMFSLEGLTTTSSAPSKPAPVKPKNQVVISREAFPIFHRDCVEKSPKHHPVLSKEAQR
ncbi:MAG: hypothetical protein ACT6FF_02630 [Methanosarcinaceae archaeon]